MKIFTLLFPAAKRGRTFKILSPKPKALLHTGTLQKFRGQQGDKYEKVKNIKRLFIIGYRFILFPASEKISGCIKMRRCFQNAELIQPFVV